MVRKAWRRCTGCGREALTTSDGHRINRDGVRIYCGTMRVIRSEHCRAAEAGNDGGNDAGGSFLKH